ncbi:helix-turn-helix transcriptional regulator [uncultured Anaerofustis sp.]|uniref:helix-turn-helix domain-containing protein n=1 Tax=uncultured Anaerofustis sp. TaxID=904996 RepID=UPI0025E10C7F|nr:helix-turn-helix transcriptional regulator [uncultured Anaerofustis sp.]
MKIEYRKLGKRLKDKRKKQGLTQEKLAEYVNLSVSHLSHIENGNEKTSLQTIVNIANILNISLDELLDLDLGKRSMFITVREIDLLFKDCTIEERKILINNLNYLKKVELK